MLMFCFFFFKQKTAYEMRISDWSSDVCSSDLSTRVLRQIVAAKGSCGRPRGRNPTRLRKNWDAMPAADPWAAGRRSARAAPAPGQVAFQERHLVGKDVAVGEDQVLHPARPERHGEQRHRRLLRGAPALARVAVEAGGDHVFPDVASALRQRLD